jgi:hypothetical protein
VQIDKTIVHASKNFFIFSPRSFSSRSKVHFTEIFCFVKTKIQFETLHTFMRSFTQFIESKLFEQTPPPATGGGVPAGGPPATPPDAALDAGPDAAPAGLDTAGGMPPMGDAGGGMPPMGGMGGGMPPMGGAGLTAPQKLQTSNIWDILNHILKK